MGCQPEAVGGSRYLSLSPTSPTLLTLNDPGSR